MAHTKRWSVWESILQIPIPKICPGILKRVFHEVPHTYLIRKAVSSTAIDLDIIPTPSSIEVCLHSFVRVSFDLAAARQRSTRAHQRPAAENQCHRRNTHTPHETRHHWHWNHFIFITFNTCCKDAKQNWLEWLYICLWRIMTLILKLI